MVTDFARNLVEYPAALYKVCTEHEIYSGIFSVLTICNYKRFPAARGFGPLYNKTSFISVGYLKRSDI